MKANDDEGYLGMYLSRRILTDLDEAAERETERLKMPVKKTGLVHRIIIEWLEKNKGGKK